MPHEVIQGLSPYHARIYEAIRERWWFFGDAPSHYELQIACRCSSTTVQQAFAELRKRGLILAPKHGVRTVKPTDLTRTISPEPLDPWADLTAEEGKPKYWIAPENG